MALIFVAAVIVAVAVWEAAPRWVQRRRDRRMHRLCQRALERQRAQIERLRAQEQ